jgi:hypothetical protein
MNDQPTAISPSPMPTDPQSGHSPIAAQSAPVSPIKTSRAHRFVVGFIVLLALAAAIGGVYEWQHKKVTSLSAQISTLQAEQAKATTATAKAGSTSAATVANPYAGWKTYTLKYEKASFKYPSSWQLTDNSTADSSFSGGGADGLVLTGTNGFEMDINDGGPNDYSFPNGGLALVYADPLTFLGQSDYMDLAESGSSNTDAVDYINLTTSKTDLTAFPADKNVMNNSSGVSGQNKFVITMDYNGIINEGHVDSSTVYPSYTYAYVLKDTNYIDAKLILESFSY